MPTNARSQNDYYPDQFDPNFNYADAYSQYANDNVRSNGGSPVVPDPPPQTTPNNTQPDTSNNNSNQQQQQQQVGHDQSFNGMSREQYRDAWMGSGAKTMQDLQNFVAQHGGQITSGNGTVLTPWGERIDMLIGARSGGNGSAGWTGQDGGSGAGAGGSGAGSGGSGSGGSGQGVPAAQSGQMTDLINMLMGRAKQSLTIDPTSDPVIQPQVSAFSAQQERSRRNYLNDLAESSNPYATGAQQTARTQTSEAASQATGQLQSQLVQNELTSRRTEIQNALSEMGSLMSAEDQMVLQKELGELNAAIQREGINSQNNQFFAQLGLNAENQSNYWDALRSGLLG